MLVITKASVQQGNKNNNGLKSKMERFYKKNTTLQSDKRLQEKPLQFLLQTLWARF